MATETGAIGGYLGPYRLKKALIDPGSTRTLELCRTSVVRPRPSLIANPHLENLAVLMTIAPNHQRSFPHRKSSYGDCASVKEVKIDRRRRNPME